MSDSLGDWGGAEFALAADRLDTPEVLEAADPSDVLRQVASAGGQIRAALRSCQEADLSAFTPDARPRAIVTVGLGSAGLAAEMLAAVVGPGSPVQVVASQADRLPGWVGAADVVIAVSGTGTDGRDARRRGRSRPPRLPPGRRRRRRTPRCSTSPSRPGPRSCPSRDPARPGRCRARCCGAWPSRSWSWPSGSAWPGSGPRCTRRRLPGWKRCRTSAGRPVNRSSTRASRWPWTWSARCRVVWGTSPLSGVAARRFAAQLSENAKYPALAGLLSEVAQSQIAVFDGPFSPGAHQPSALPAPPRELPEDEEARALRELPGLEDLSSWELDYDEAESADPARASGFTPLRLILITDPDTDERVTAQHRVITELVEQRQIGLSELAMDGEHPLVRLAGVVQLTDYASVYLAVASGIDPAAAAAITDFQTRIE